MPKRNTGSGRALRAAEASGEDPVPAPGAADPVLDAAKATVLDFGVRRATLTEVARRAGLSRMTVYRRYADGNELMRAVMSREFGAVLLEAQRRAAGIEDGRQRVLAGVMGTLEMLIDHPLMVRLLELEPEMLLPYLTYRVGEFQRAGREALAAWLREAQATGGVRAGDPAQMAATIELTLRGPVLAARTLSGPDREARLAELRRMIEAYLTPAVG